MSKSLQNKYYINKLLSSRKDSYIFQCIDINQPHQLLVLFISPNKKQEVHQIKVMMKVNKLVEKN